MTRSFIPLSICVLVFLQIETVLYAQTSVSGIISSNTTWAKTGSPYNLVAKVQVKENVTLTIEPGVTINGNNQQIEVFGNLTAAGSSNSKITFNNTSILGSPLINYFATLNIQHANFKGGGVLTTLVGYLMSLTLRDCRLDGCSVMYITGTIGTSNSYVERNIFVNSGGIDTWINGDGVAYIRNNVFYQQTSGSAIQNRVSSFIGTSTVAEYNSFLSTDRVAINLPSGYSTARVSALNNYWNTTDVALINAMIIDRNDDLQIASVVPYVPFLTAPHVNTPAFPMIWISQTSLNFGNVAAGSSSNLNFKLKNTSSGTLAIASITSSNPRFSIAPTSVNLGTGDSVTISVSFSPSTFGAQNGTLTLVHNAENSVPSITVSGTGISPSIALTPLVLDFGKVTVGQSSTRSFQISNVGNSPMTVDSIVCKDDLFGLQTSSLTILAGASTGRTVTYRPTAVRKDSAMVSIYHTAPGSPSSIVLKGEGVRSNLILSTRSIVFNEVRYKPWIDTVLVLTNSGGDTLRVTSVTSDNPVFSVRRGTFAVPPSQSFADTIRFSPISVGVYSGRLLITSDSPTSPDTVLLSGTRQVLSLVESSADHPTRYVLEQNYPNPFNPSTSIRFSVVRSRLVSLKVYDLLGREVATLVNEEMNPGSYKVSFDATRLSSGVYFYCLHAGEFVQTKKLALQK